MPGETACYTKRRGGSKIMDNTWDAYRKLENLAFMEYHNALKSGALDDEVQRAHDFWQDVVQLVRRAR